MLWQDGRISSKHAQLLHPKPRLFGRCGSRRPAQQQSMQLERAICMIAPHRPDQEAMAASDVQEQKLPPPLGGFILSTSAAAPHWASGALLHRRGFGCGVAFVHDFLGAEAKLNSYGRAVRMRPAWGRRNGSGAHSFGHRCDCAVSEGVGSDPWSGLSEERYPEIPLLGSLQPPHMHLTQATDLSPAFAGAGSGLLPPTCRRSRRRRSGPRRAGAFFTSNGYVETSWPLLILLTLTIYMYFEYHHV